MKCILFINIKISAFHRTVMQNAKRPFKELHRETVYAHAGLCSDCGTGAISTPIHQTATFRHSGINESTGFDYSRTSNPTRTVVEQAMARLEGGVAGFAFSSGMAAITALASLFKPGDRVILSQDIYGGTYRLFEHLLKPLGIEPVYVDTSDLGRVRDALTLKTAALFIETPGNPLLRITDIKSAAALARAVGCMVIVDNTFMTPYLQRPLSLGADIVVHSATKFLGGHNDVLAGIVVTNRGDLAEKIAFIQNATGGVLAPFDSWILIRGIKTLAIRIQQAQTNAAALALWLAKHKKIQAVYYPGLSRHPGHLVHKKQASGAGAIVSFRMLSKSSAFNVLKKVKVISFAESLGGVETLITHPACQTHADMPKDFLKTSGITDDLLRISVGIEHIDDIIEDLGRSL